MLKSFLNDAHIRQALIRYLNEQKLKPKAVLEELRVCNGNAIADVVALFEEAHCYEIKGATDKIERINVQSTYYNAAFRWITLVTTDQNLERAFKICPQFWGIMVACNGTEIVTLRQIRRPKQNPQFTKEVALLTLWKSEMLQLVQEQEHQRQPRDTLAQLIAAAMKKSELSSYICKMLLSRHAGDPFKARRSVPCKKYVR